MWKLRAAAASILAATALGLLLWRGLAQAAAQGPLPWELYGGPDGYYIARGWTEGYASRPLAVAPRARVEAAMTHTLHLPATYAGPAPRETRALWVTRWDFQTLSDVQTIVDKAAYAHLNTILFQVRGQADALYRSSLEPWSARLSGTLGQDPGWDPLAELTARAHAAGLQVQAWINVYPAWLGTTATLPPTSTVPLPMLHDFTRCYGDRWLQWSPAGPMQLPPPGAQPAYLCASPGHPAVVERVVAVCQDLLTHYPLDGLHFDYVRYAGREYSQDPVSLEAYAAAAAANPALTYADWQRAQITHLLQRVCTEALPLRPAARLTATAWPVYQDHWGWVNHNDGYHAHYQDSQGWARQGVVAGIMPMLYSASIHDVRERFEVLARDFVAGSQPGGVVIGIGGDYASFAEIAGRIEVARAVGARGQALFSYRLLDERDYWRSLRDGPYQRIAIPNWP